VTLEKVGHNQSKAAKILGISRSTLRKKIAQYRIS
jgi:Fis family transcriptional regulator